MFWSVSKIVKSGRLLVFPDFYENTLWPFLNRLQFFCEALRSIQLCIGASQDTLCILGKINLQSEQIFLQQEIPE